MLRLSLRSLLCTTCVLYLLYLVWLLRNRLRNRPKTEIVIMDRQSNHSIVLDSVHKKVQIQRAELPALRTLQVPADAGNRPKTKIVIMDRQSNHSIVLDSIHEKVQIQRAELPALRTLQVPADAGRSCDAWAILFSEDGVDAVLTGKAHFKKAQIRVPDGYLSCWSADPFVVNGMVFAEIYQGEYGSPSGKGQIGAARLINGSLSFVPAITEDWHLSYPFAFYSKQDLFVLPEQHKSKESHVIIYNCTTIPCVRHKFLWAVAPRNLIDFAIIAYKETVFLTSTDHRTKVREKSTFILSAQDLVTSDCKRSSLTPMMKSAVNGFRGAGAVLQTMYGKLLPVQSNEGIYGKHIILYDISSWERLTMLEVPSVSGFCGVHHVSVDPNNPNLVVVDVKGRFMHRRNWCSRERSV